METIGGGLGFFVLRASRLKVLIKESCNTYEPRVSVAVRASLGEGSGWEPRVKARLRRKLYPLLFCSRGGVWRSLGFIPKP